MKHYIELEISNIMSMELDPLKTTPSDLHRFWVQLGTVDQWYALMRECRSWFGKNWKCQAKVRKKLGTASMRWNKKHISVWFDVPDPRWATWVATKLALQVVSETKQKAAK